MIGVLIGRSPPPKATASPPVATGARSGAGACQTDVVTVSVVSGEAPFTILWTNVGGDSSVQAANATSFATRMQATLALGETKTATIRGTVTDHRNETSFVDISAALYEIS